MVCVAGPEAHPYLFPDNRTAESMMNYDQVLTEAGENGLKAEKVARHVFNACNSLFCPASYDDVHRYVAQFLQRSARNPDSIIEKADARGVYFLNPDAHETQQLMLRFSRVEEEEESKAPPVDLSLSLF